MTRFKHLTRKKKKEAKFSKFIRSIGDHNDVFFMEIKKRMVLFTVVTDTGTESMFFKRLLSSNISLWDLLLSRFQLQTFFETVLPRSFRKMDPPGSIPESEFLQVYECYGN